MANQPTLREVNAEKKEKRKSNLFLQNPFIT
jgi:hypothetical protein